MQHVTNSAVRASTLSGAFPLGMLLAVSMVARIYERLPGRSQARMIVGLILAAAVCCVLEAMVIMSQPFTPEGNGYLLGFLLLCHAACIGVGPSEAGVPLVRAAL